jgi:hypothetical protein
MGAERWVKKGAEVIQTVESEQQTVILSAKREK